MPKPDENKDMPLNEPQKIQPEAVTQAEQNQNKAADGSLLATIGSVQGRLSALLAKLAQKGKTVVGGEAAAGQSTAGLSEGAAQQLSDLADSCTREADAQLTIPAVGDAVLAMAAPEPEAASGRDVSAAELFRTITGADSLPGMPQAARGAGRGGIS